MNLSELQSKVIEQLAENATPKHWPLSEITDNINEGQRQFLRDTELQTFMLALTSAGAGGFYLPHDIMKLKHVYYLGRRLPKKSITFLETRYSGTDNLTGVIGDGRSNEGNFRDTEGAPRYCYLENGNINVYPKPSATVTPSSNIRETQSATLSASSLALTLSTAITLDSSRVELWLNGVKQHHTQWSITNANLITAVGPAIPIALDAEVRWIPDTVTSALLATTRYFQIFLAAGSTKIMIPGGYVQGVGALTISINGVEQAASAITEASPAFCLLTSAVGGDCMVEAGVTHPNPFGAASALYIPRSADMSQDGEEPIIPTDFHRALWQYACYLCLIHEGKKTQDIQKAAIYQGLYQKTVTDASSLVASEVTVDFASRQGFVL